MKRVLGIAITGAAALLSGCATTSRPGPIDVTRFHLGTPIAGDSVSVETLTAFAGVSPEDQVYIAAVSGEMARLGFTPCGGSTSPFIAAVSYKHVSRGMVRKPPPVTIGIGGGSYSGGRRGGVGLGAGGSFGVGGGTAELISTELDVQLKRRSVEGDVNYVEVNRGCKVYTADSTRDLCENDCDRVREGCAKN